MKEFMARGCLWKDCTSYSQGDKERVPTAFETRVGTLKITITNGHIHHRPEFICHCFGLQMDTVELPNAATHQEAAEQAFDLAHTIASSIYEAFEVVSNKLT